MLTPIRSSSLVTVMIGRMFVPMCNRFHATEDNSDKITILEEGRGCPRAQAFLNLEDRCLDR